MTPQKASPIRRDSVRFHLCGDPFYPSGLREVRELEPVGGGQAAKGGADVAFTYRRDEESAKETAAAIEALGRKVMYLQADVSNEEDAKAAAASVIEKMGKSQADLSNLEMKGPTITDGRFIYFPVRGVPIAIRFGDVKDLACRTSSAGYQCQYHLGARAKRSSLCHRGQFGKRIA